MGSKEKGFASSVKGAWKKFVGSVGKAYDKTVQTAGETIELNRLNARRKELDRQNTDLYAKIGMQVYRAAGEQIERSAFLEQISQIERNYAEQRELLLREARLKAASPATNAEEEALSEEPLEQALSAAGEADKGALPDAAEPDRAEKTPGPSAAGNADISSEPAGESVLGVEEGVKAPEAAVSDAESADAPSAEEGALPTAEGAVKTREETAVDTQGESASAVKEAAGQSATEAADTPDSQS